MPPSPHFFSISKDSCERIHCSIKVKYCNVGERCWALIGHLIVQSLDSSEKSDFLEKSTHNVIFSTRYLGCATTSSYARHYDQRLSFLISECDASNWWKFKETGWTLLSNFWFYLNILIAWLTRCYLTTLRYSIGRFAVLPKNIE